MDSNTLKKYARLLIKKGVDIQKEQTLMISSPVECYEFTRIVTEVAYEEGAKEVVIDWDDEITRKLKYLHASDDVFDTFPEWLKDYYNTYSRKGAALLSIAASNPELMKDVDPNRLMRFRKVAAPALKETRDRQMTYQNAWTVASVPTKAWAKKIFPDISEEAAMKKLWDAIIKTVRVDHEDPVASWEKHSNNLKKHADFLNNSHFKSLKFKNSLGTDLEVQLPEKHKWMGGAKHTTSGVEFIANIPTEEVFTCPKKTGVNGIVYSSKPLNYQGNLIEDFSITFKDGRVANFTAKEGYDSLKSLIETDDGSHYLGEVALVPYDSPISKSNILFFNTLFDENASCHLALGKAYPTSLRDSDGKSVEELEKMGANDSITHVDFMFGTKDLHVVGVTQDNKEVEVFRDGNFVI